MSSDIRVRFAPSPTGKIHIGNIRTAIFNYLFARHHGGKFLLRVEDTDRERCTPEAEALLFDALAWLELDYDREGEEGFLRQSTRTTLYRALVEEWLKEGLAYTSDKPTGLTGGKAQSPPSASGEAIWFKAPREDLVFDDLILGRQTQPRRQLQDFVIVRSTGAPMFILANTIDDIEMGITHVLRGVDHKTNTFRQVLLYRALGAVPPRFGHLPLLVDTRGKKLSKREDDPNALVYVGEFRARGFLPAALINYLALLGWSPRPTENEQGETIFREKLSRDELIAEFDLGRVRAAPAQFDPVKLGAINYRYILDRLESAPDSLIAHLKKDAHREGLDSNRLTDEQYATLIREAGTRVRTLNELIDAGRCFFTDRVDVDPAPKAVRKVFRKEGVWQRVDAAIERLEQIADEDWNRATALAVIKELAERIAGGKLGEIAQPIRILCTGSPASPPIDITLELLGKARTLSRLRDEKNRRRLAEAL